MTPAELKSARKALGLTQGQLASMLGYKSGLSVRRFEMPVTAKGHREIPFHVEWRINYILRGEFEPRDAWELSQI